MTWKGHMISTFAASYAFSQNVPLSMTVSAFSYLPDLVELGGGRLLFHKHRGMSHNLFMWIGILLAMIPLMFHPTIIQMSESLMAIGAEPFWVLAPAMGALMHLVEDSLSLGGIPIWRNKKVAFKLYRTGTMTEAFVVAGFVIVAVILTFSPF